jgi:hypothetical protein
LARGLLAPFFHRIEPENRQLISPLQLSYEPVFFVEEGDQVSVVEDGFLEPPVTFVKVTVRFDSPVLHQACLEAVRARYPKSQIEPHQVSVLPIPWVSFHPVPASASIGAGFEIGNPEQWNPTSPLELNIFVPPEKTEKFIQHISNRVVGYKYSFSVKEESGWKGQAQSSTTFTAAVDALLDGNSEILIHRSQFADLADKMVQKMSLRIFQDGEEPMDMTSIQKLIQEAFSNPAIENVMLSFANRDEWKSNMFSAADFEPDRISEYTLHLMERDESSHSDNSASSRRAENSGTLEILKRSSAEKPRIQLIAPPPP